MSGKGGSGKTTISGTLARLAGMSGRRVLAIDADTNPNLSISLGLAPGAVDDKAPLPHGLMEHRRIDGEMRLSLSKPVDEVTSEYGVAAPDGVQLLMVGQVKGAATGCMCSSHATVRGLLHDLPSDDGSIVVVDAEASPEHLSRATVEAVDLQLIVAEPYFKSLETARRYAKLGHDLGISNVRVVANKVRNHEDGDAIAAFCDTHGMELTAVVPFDESLGRAERAGVAPVDFDPGGPSVTAIKAIMAGLLSNGARR